MSSTSPVGNPSPCRKNGLSRCSRSCRGNKTGVRRHQGRPARGTRPDLTRMSFPIPEACACSRVIAGVLDTASRREGHSPFLIRALSKYIRRAGSSWIDSIRNPLCRLDDRLVVLLLPAVLESRTQRLRADDFQLALHVEILPELLQQRPIPDLFKVSFLLRIGNTPLSLSLR